MQDLYCRRCGEAWENDTIHEEVALRQQSGEAASYESVARLFRRHGCAAFREFTGTDQPCEPSPGNVWAASAGALYDVLGSDMDGVAAMLDDLNL